MLVSHLLCCGRGDAVRSIELGAIRGGIGSAGVLMLSEACRRGHLRQLAHLSLQDCPHKKSQI